MEKNKLDEILRKIDGGREYRQMTVRALFGEEEDPDKKKDEEEPADDKDDEADDKDADDAEDKPADDDKAEEEKPAEDATDDEKDEPDDKDEDDDDDKKKPNGKFIVEGYASTFSEPYELLSVDGYTIREQIDPNAFKEADMSDVIMQYDHQGRVFARGSNGTLEVSTDGHGLHMRADLSGTEAGRQLYEEIKGGYTSKMSFGFTVDEDRQEVTENAEAQTVDVLRTITKVRKLYDVSAVSLPANDGTEISARSYGNGVIAGLKAERLKSVAIKEARAKALALLTKYQKGDSNVE